MRSAVVAVLTAAAALPGAASCLVGGACAVEAEASVLLQRSSAKPVVATSAMERIKVKGGAFTRGDTEVVMLGGNYVWKAAPYFPPKAIVERNAKQIAEELASSAYIPKHGADGKHRISVPCVRLGAMMEGMMPDEAGKIDGAWVQALDDAISAFAAHGVYVFLDAHGDAWSTTNGGTGFPWWMSAYMQETAGSDGKSFITSPEHPLEIAIPDALADVLRKAGAAIPEISVVESDPDPWRNFSVGSGVGNPRYMNIGNINMRKNNNDKAWAEANLIFTKQVQNAYHRFLKSPGDDEDRKQIFMPYVEFIKELFSMWDRHSNVVAVELLNEPPPTGLPCVKTARKSRTNLWMFYANVLDELDKLGVHPDAPVALQDVSGTLPGANRLYDALFSEPSAASGEFEMKKLKAWASRGKLVLSFHFYPGFATQVGMEEMIELARKEAAKWGQVPLFFSEFWGETAQEMADVMAGAGDDGVDAITYWHYVDREYTGQPGWYIYNAATLAKGDPVSDEGEINWEAWREYIKTVFDGTFIGADITGADNGRTDVLRLLPKQAPETPEKLGSRSLPTVS
mmetsp:Transcript_1530/g.4131  ORF Transcript_1530/g.4131 Transcript_1530/m.4131 type:complete len:570 (+) Transcript_1530:82-1791(+)